jgi:polyferredoxin
MKIVTTRRICQTVFLLIFLFFCGITTFGTEWYQIRNWPVNLFLWLDPLVAISTMLATHTLYAPLLLSLITVVLTIIFGRFFCGWVCPFGTMHQFTGYMTHRKARMAEKIELNKYRKWQKIKYYILILFLVAAALPAFGSLLTGLLDPIPLVYRSINIVLLPAVDNHTNIIFSQNRWTTTAWAIGIIFLAAILANLWIPRFYCRFICPLGALMGILGRFAIWRIGKNSTDTINCKLCEKNCEGGCDPSGNIKISECVLCFNCRSDCVHELISYQTSKSFEGEVTSPDVSRRGFMLSLASGVLAIPAVRLSGKLASNWDNGLIRPPGSLPEAQFLERCIKCGQCMRICPTNVLQPAGIASGFEVLWTPTLNNRIGSSGCQFNCVACGYVCPTAAIRPISIDEKHGTGDFADSGPVKLGTAFFDRNRCLPWAMDKPCLVCQENCPVSPKAIFTKETFSIVRNGDKVVEKFASDTIHIADDDMQTGSYATGDYFITKNNEPDRLYQIIDNSKNSLTIKNDEKMIFKNGDKILLKVRLQRPYVDIEKCIGCGICEHECPVSGQRAIRVSAEGETRNKKHGLLI